MTIDRTKYYLNYYNRSKFLYKIKYREKKEAEERRVELYKPYGGEENYYKNELLKWGMKVKEINPYKEKKIKYDDDD